MAPSQMQVTPVEFHIVEAVWNHHTVGEARVVVVEGPEHFLGQQLALAVKIAEQGPFQGVDAQQGIGRSEVLLLELGNFVELSIPVRMLVHAAVYAYNRRPLPLHLVGPCVALTAADLATYYTRTDNGTVLNFDAVKTIPTIGEELHGSS